MPTTSVKNEALSPFLKSYCFVSKFRIWMIEKKHPQLCSSSPTKKEEVMLFLLLVPFMLFTSSGADPLFVVCSNTSNYTLNSPFEVNFRRLLLSLSSNTSSSGFFNTSVGDIPNQVYGLALCRGDVIPSDCQNCVKTASEEIIKKCPNNREAIIWYELCQVRYSYRNFFSEMVYFGKYPLWNERANNISNPSKYSVILELIDNLSSEAAFVPANQMFATGKVKISRTEEVYGLVQCTRDISANFCKTCLQNARGDIEGCCFPHGGGMILSTSCNLRYDLDPFYRASSPPPSTTSTVNGDGRDIPKVVTLASVPAIILLLLIGSCSYYLCWRKRLQKDEEKSQQALLHAPGPPNLLVRNMQEGNSMNPQKLSFMDFATIKASTDNFSDLNKLGQGGFGTVYKGMLLDGKEIAVKRLSKRSGQGLNEFKNEVVLIAKLQHRNLVRLLGCGIEGEEKLLIYEFMPNTSLDVFIFDQVRRSQLDWRTRFNIIDGIARGLLYLHEDSRLKIIHRDLKPSNVLLDHDMVAKISDFGMAKIFCEDQNAANTRRIVGTYGYMAPEYAMEGLFSDKSDVFSYGVVLLEVISGKKNSGFYLTEHAQTLIAYAWRQWNEKKELDFVDPLLMESCLRSEVLRCIHVGLLCVQEDAADRPTMSSVVVMLESESMALPEPRQPAFSVGRVVVQFDQSLTVNYSVNENTISNVSPR